MRQHIRNYLVKEVNLDIVYDVRLKKQRDVFANYLRQLKANGKGAVRHFQDISKEDMTKVVEVLDQDNPQQLQMLAWWYVQLFFCKRGIENTAEMQKCDINFDSVGGRTIAKLGRNWASKNHQEVDEDMESGGLISEIKDHPKCPIHILRKYISKLNPTNEALWQRPKENFKTEDDSWYINARLGHNSIANMMKKISAQCSLSKIYTNHSVRVSSCTLLGAHGFTDIDITAVSKHKSLDSLAIYKRTKAERKIEMATALSRSMGLNPLSTSINSTVTEASTIIPPPSAISLNPFPSNMAVSEPTSTRKFPFIAVCDNDLSQHFQLNLAEESEVVDKFKNQRTDTGLSVTPRDQQRLDKIIVLNNCSHITLNL
jgi:hypothetical protein